MEFILAKETDLPLIGELAARIWQVWYPPIIGQAQVDYMLERMYSEASLRDQMLNQAHQFFILTVDNQTIGYASVSEKDKGDYFIHKLYVDTNQHKKGLGAAFLQFLSRYFQPQTFRLCVNRQNIAAINFYFKNGFVIEKAADFDIGGGYFMNDFVMCKQFL